MSEEVFRINYKTPQTYNAAKKAVIMDSMRMDLIPPVFSFDDATHAIICHQSHFYVRTVFQGTNTAKSLELQHNTFNYFTNHDIDNSLLSVIPNMEGYKKRRQEALEFYQAHTPTSPPPFGLDLNRASGGEVIASLLAYPKSCLGEYHSQRAPRRLLIDNMHKLKEAGAVLLLEHFPVDMQPLLDEYLAGDGKHISPKLGLYCDKMDEIYNSLGRDGLVGVLERARETGVKIQGIEDPFSLDASFFGAIAPLPGTTPEALGDKDMPDRVLFDRVLLMNHNAVKAAQDLEKKGIKSFTFCGFAHVGEYKDFSGLMKVPGLAASYGSPLVEVRDKPTTFMEKEAVRMEPSSVFRYDPDHAKQLPANGFAGKIDIHCDVQISL